ncbi:MAG: hypothetical protein A2519_10520 [Candidatus Raymondbacteria bacterium RIFOXYD12_FULL_49_13]|uniref:histidine kinase n=1 Tax=Candidatus Raymondbacteria bacterium RIFOXYD12_FULL_49_13 TaxID=1817890 RepID=A0A1F7F196_UNCRA|nr:MAG: hypothetical protein A2519_10520 [Candidatus Raymondbacteria bacterium RIFOXYD12_FULL_49_13]
MKKIVFNKNRRLVAAVLLAIALPSFILLILGLRAVRNERYVFEHKMMVNYREMASSCVQYADTRLDEFERRLDSIADRDDFGKTNHLSVQALYYLGRQQNIIYPSRLPSRRFFPLAFARDPSPQLAILFAGENDAKTDSYSKYAEFLSSAEAESGENRLTAKNGLMRSALKSGRVSACMETADRVLRDTTSFFLPVSLSPKIAAFFFKARGFAEQGQADAAGNAFLECYEYLLSDSAEIFSEEFTFYTGKIERELPAYPGSAETLARFKQRKAALVKELELKALVESYARNRLLPDSGYFYRDSTILYVHGYGPNKSIVAVVDLSWLISLVNQWIAAKKNVAMDVSFFDGRSIFTNKPPSSYATRQIAVTTSLSERLPFINITFFDSDPAEFTDIIRHQRLLYLSLLALLLTSILIGAGFAYFAIRKEMALTRLRSSFMSSVSHELKPPLTSIRMFGDMLQSGKITDEKKKTAYYGLISRESERLSILIDKILDFSRLEDGRIKYDFGEHGLETLVAEALAALTLIIEEKHVAVQRKTSADDPVVRCDSRMVVQVMVNLIDNAIKYSPTKKDIEIETGREGRWGFVAVRDWGIGIQAGEKSKIFDEFYRSDHMHVRDVKGTGLGLAIVRKITADHGGFARAESPSDGGLRVVVGFPLEK